MDLTFMYVLGVGKQIKNKTKSKIIDAFHILNR